MSIVRTFERRSSYNESLEDRTVNRPRDGVMGLPKYSMSRVLSISSKMYPQERSVALAATGFPHLAVAVPFLTLMLTLLSPPSDDS